MVEEIECIVIGRVQGVGFRYFAYDEATALGLRGFVENLRDGKVRVVAQGPRRALEDLVGKLRQGPVSARVEGFEVNWREVPSFSLDGFILR